MKWWRVAAGWLPLAPWGVVMWETKGGSSGSPRDRSKHNATVSVWTSVFFTKIFPKKNLKQFFFGNRREAPTAAEVIFWVFFWENPAAKRPGVIFWVIFWENLDFV